MKFSCEKYELQNACVIASRAVAAKSPMDILEGLHLHAAGDKITVKGYDLKKGIYTSIGADIVEGGKIVVNARMFGEMMRRLPDGTVHVDIDEKDNIKVRCGQSHFDIMGTEAKDFPELPTFDAVNNITLPQSILKSMINQTSFAISTDEIRPIYTGTLFEIEGDILNLVAVDGYRLAKRTEQLDKANMEDCSFVVPGSALSDVEKVCSDEEGDVRISVGKKHINFVIGNTVIVTRRLEGEFLNYRRALPTEFKYIFKVNRSELISTVDRMSLVTNEKHTAPVRMTFGDGTIHCLCLTPIGRAEDICSCEGDGNNIEVGFNDRYIKDALKAANRDELLLCINSDTNPCIIKAADGEEKFTYMVLPVRLRAK